MEDRRNGEKNRCVILYKGNSVNNGVSIVVKMENQTFVDKNSEKVKNKLNTYTHVNFDGMQCWRSVQRKV